MKAVSTRIQLAHVVRRCRWSQIDNSIAKTIYTQLGETTQRLKRPQSCLDHGRVDK